MSEPRVAVRRLGPDDAALVERAAHLFDRPILPGELCAFLASERDFLWFAFLGEAPAGFASATMILHPDQRPVLFLNEIGVDEPFQRRGIGSALIAAVIALAQERGWQSTWVLAESEDARAMAFYRALAPATAQDCRMFEWETP